MFNIEYYPEDIANTLCNIAYDNPSEQLINDIEKAVFHLRSIAENKYNSDYFRTFYRLLERIVDVSE